MTEYIRRDRYLRQLIRKKDSGEVKIITGLRRCGKSWLLGKLYHDWLTGQGVPEDHIVSISPDGQDLQPGADLPDPLRLIHCLRERIRDDGRYGSGMTGAITCFSTGFRRSRALSGQ